MVATTRSKEKYGVEPPKNFQRQTDTEILGKYRLIRKAIFLIVQQTWRSPEETNKKIPGMILISISALCNLRPAGHCAPQRLSLRPPPRIVFERASEREREADRDRESANLSSSRD